MRSIPTFACGLIVSFLVASCADDAIYWELPPDMTDEERAAFGEGLELCNHIATMQQFIAGPGEGNRRVELRRPENMITSEFAAGEYASDLGLMTLVRGQSHGRLVMVAAHEAMHALAVRHHSGRGIMNAGLNPGSEPPVSFTDDDRAACRRAEACP